MRKLLNKFGYYTEEQAKDIIFEQVKDYIENQKWCKHKYKTIDTKDVILCETPIRNFYQECEKCGQIRTLER